MAFRFQPAVRQQRKARIGIVGPSGSGKTYTALQIATGFGGRIAVVDTENYSSSLYADQFQFDVLNLETFAPLTYVQAIRAAEQAGYDVLVIDSLSHAWSGREGALEQVDKAAARSRSGNTFAAWREVTPQHNEMVETIIRAGMHVIVTMRAKTEYVMEAVQRGGRTVHEPRKIGMAPIQRDGMEYEFDVVADMDWEHRFIVSKTRVPFLDGEVITKPGPDLGQRIHAWLMEGEAAPVPTPTQQGASVATAPTQNVEDAVTEALTRYHAAASAVLPNDEDRKDFLRLASWVMDRRDNPQAVPVASTRELPPPRIHNITRNIEGRDTEHLLDMLAGWRAEWEAAQGSAPADERSEVVGAQTQLPA